MEAQKRQLYTKQYKDDAVRQVADAGKRLAVVAREVGVAKGLIGRWVRKTKARGSQRFAGTGHQTSLEEEISRLRRDNARL